MDMRGHHMEAAPHHDMTSLPMHTSHTGSSASSFMQNATASNTISAVHAEGSAPTSIGQLHPSVTKVKIITSSSIAGGSHGNNGLAPAASVIGVGGSFGNNGQATSYTHTSADACFGNNSLKITSAPGPRDPGSCATGINNNGKTSGHSSTPLPKSPPTTHAEDIRIPSSLELKPSKKPVKYRECLKNHAANLGGHATDGCGEFMPSGEEGTIEALKCAACNCHRNFHRKEVEGEFYAGSCECRYGGRDRKRMIEPLFPSPLPLPPPPLPGLRMHSGAGMLPSSQMIMAFNSHDSDEYDGGLISPQSSLKKRYRTKFTQEQKEQMRVFAEKLEWRIQKHDEAAVQQFCAEVGVKRHVLKVWMHNNKHALGKKLLTEGPITMGEEEELRS